MNARPLLPALAMLGALALIGADTSPRPGSDALPDSLRPSSWWLSRLPDGEAKRRFVLDCTGCHQFNETRVREGAVLRGEKQWASDVARMLRYAGPRSGFPVIAERDSQATASWLWSALSSAFSGTSSAAGDVGAGTSWGTADVREYDVPVAMDLPHDLAVDDSGAVLITGMFTHQVYRLDPEPGTFTTTPIPVDKANPRAIEVDAAGNWWLVLGGPRRIARFEPKTGHWSSWEVGFYAHSLALAPNGLVWSNGHFTRDPELAAVLDPASGKVRVDTLPSHPSLTKAGGPVPYELRVARDGTVWMSELQGNRMVRIDPRGGRAEAFPLPTSWSGPRRFDVDSAGVLWIPEYSNNRLARFDPRTKRFDEHVLPIRDAVPYIARVHPHTGAIWIGTAAADAVLRFDPATRTFTAYRLPTRGATVRHLTFDPANGDVWLAYGASPALHAARVARLRVR
jgi:virginiamycin B lyase